jgi:CxxC motif-containing protein
MSKTEKELICISCPIGCRLTAKITGEDISIEGNRCPRGIEYGREEILSPKRVVTATAAVKGGKAARLPVKTDAPLLKEHIPGLLDSLYQMELEAPVKRGTVIMEDLYGTGTNLVASGSAPVK